MSTPHSLACSVFRNRRQMATLALLLLSALALALPAAHSAGPPCLPCGGISTDLAGIPAIASALAEQGPLAEGAALYVAWDAPALAGTVDTYAVSEAAQRLRAVGVSPWLRLRFATPSPLIGANAAGLEAELAAAARYAAAVGAGGHFSIVWDVVDPQPGEFAFLLKRAAVTVNGAVREARVIAGPVPADDSFLRALYAEDVSAYLDGIAFSGSVGAEGLAGALALVAELDPGKPVVRDLAASGAEPFDRLAIAAEDAVRGISLTIFDGDASADGIAALRLLANEFRGDLSFDSSSVPAEGREGSAAATWPFVRGEDLSLRVIARAPQRTPGESWVLTFPDPGIRRVQRVDARTGQASGLRGRVVGSGVEVTMSAPATDSSVVLRLERASAAELAGADQIVERLDVSEERQMPVEEILRRLQAFEDAQRRRLLHYEGTNATSLRFAGGAQSIDATFEGAYFVESGKAPDWAWQRFFLNGIQWRSKTLPEIPLIQPEKAAAQPLEILFTRQYRYSLRGMATVEGRDCWVVDFAPVGPATDGEVQRLYQGTVWIDRKTFARVRSKALQLGLQGDVLSNEETLVYTPIDVNGAPAAWPSASNSDVFVLPLLYTAQQLFSVINTSTLVERRTELRDVRVNADGFADRRAAVFASEATMVRDTDKGLRYLVKAEGEDGRVVKEGFDADKLFLLGGIFYEESLDYPLPLAGLNYLNLDLRGQKKQLNAFFAGALGIVNYADPSLFGSRWDAGADLFAFALPIEDTLYRDGEEIEAQNVETTSYRVALNLGRPLGSYTKFSSRYRAEYRNFREAENTAPDFVLPSDTVTHSVELGLDWSRSGFQFDIDGSFHRRSTWEPWGLPGSTDYDPDAQDYALWSASLAKVWHLGGFKKVGVELNYFDGADLDRFSKYEFGFFGDTRVHGYRSDRVRAESGWAAHATYGFEVGQLFRLDALADVAWATDEATGLDQELLAGVGVQGTFLGPWQTVVNLDLGVPVAGPEDGFVVYVVFLKLFR